MPFDWKSSFGFLITMAVQYLMFVWMVMIGACVAVLVIGFYVYVIAMSKCIKQILSAIDKSLRVKTNRKRIGVQLIEFIEFHTQVKQLSHLIRSKNISHSKHNIIF